MELQVLGSSSAGNGYILTSESGQVLLIEGGFPLLDIKRRIGYKVSSIAGCLVTHEHVDHARRIGEYLDKASFNVYASPGTCEALKASYSDSVASKAERRLIACEAGKRFNVGEFSVIPMENSIMMNGERMLLHDSAQPYCFQIYHKEMGVLLFATDLYCLPTTKFQNIAHIMVECNYDVDKLQGNLASGKIDKGRYERAWFSHMNVTTLCGQLRRMDLSKVVSIGLLHTSHQNGLQGAFVDMVARATGKSVYMAQEGLKWSLNRDAPF